MATAGFLLPQSSQPVIWADAFTSKGTEQPLEQGRHILDIPRNRKTINDKNSKKKKKSQKSLKILQPK